MVAVIDCSRLVPARIHGPCNIDPSFIFTIAQSGSLIGVIAPNSNQDGEDVHHPTITRDDQ